MSCQLFQRVPHSTRYLNGDSDTHICKYTHTQNNVGHAYVYVCVCVCVCVYMYIIDILTYTSKIDTNSFVLSRKYLLNGTS